MSTRDSIRGGRRLALPLDGRGLRIAIVVADWNSTVTKKLLEGAVERLKACDAREVTVMHVPGAFELTNAAARLKAKRCRLGGFTYDAIIAIGCVVRGDTPHFDYVCQSAAYGITLLNACGKAGDRLHENFAPVIFGVLTTDTMEQALERAGGSLGNKGEEAADAAIQMCRPRTHRLV